MAIELTQEARTDLISAIKHYFLEERDEELGDLQASFFLDFVLESLAPTIYNQAIRDAQLGLQRAIAELDTTMYQPEVGYGQRGGGRGSAGRKGRR